jgi:hypothetical protein
VRDSVSLKVKKSKEDSQAPVLTTVILATQQDSGSKPLQAKSKSLSQKYPTQKRLIE